MMAYMKSDGGYGAMNGLSSMSAGGGPNSQSMASAYLKAQQNPYSVNGMGLSTSSDLLHGNVGYPNSKFGKYSSAP
jgi:hypothetical protein